ncbi:MAG: NAD(P)/FAD-dependent oxidoreductase, partial [Deltaproteobacteria bacterium]|nr:NAD(P)/FAD-dependent oxidoreductase [Deltaproteobacteria bacterium]
DGRPPIVMYSIRTPENMEKTKKSIAQYSKHDAEVWHELRSKVAAMDPQLAAAFYSPPMQPTPEIPDPVNFMTIQQMEALGLPRHFGVSSAKAIIDHCFESDELRALLYRMSVEWGCPLNMEGLGSMVIFAVLWVTLNWRLSVGGTHTFAHALAMAAVKEGVHIYENSDVVKILVENGKAVGVRLASGEEIEARKLVSSNACAKQTLLRLVGEEHLSPLWAKRAKEQIQGPSCVLASTAFALHEAPRYKSARWNPDIDRCYYTVTGFDTAQQVHDYCADAESGRIPSRPGVGTYVNSLWDPTYAPPGKHSLTGWLFFPVASAYTEKEWDECRRTYNQKIIDHFVHWAPNMTRENVLDDFFYTPLDQEREMRLMEGDFNNGAVRPDQLGWMRPFPEASKYKTEIENLYMCGPCMHPGGGISAGSGYASYKQVAEDYGLKKLWEGHPRGY